MQSIAANRTAAQVPTAELARIAQTFDVRSISSRLMVELANQLQAAGAIGMEEHALLAFQPEMNACYDVVGAQHVRRPDPDSPRDALAEWKQILANQEQWELSESFLNVSRRIVTLLDQLAALGG